MTAETESNAVWAVTQEGEGYNLVVTVGSHLAQGRIYRWSGGITTDSNGNIAVSEMLQSVSDGDRWFSDVSPARIKGQAGAESSATCQEMFENIARRCRDTSLEEEAKASALRGKIQDAMDLLQDMADGGPRVLRDEE